MELNKLKSPCDRCIRETNKLGHSCTHRTSCQKYLEWYRDIMDEVRLIFLEQKLGVSSMKKCAVCKYGVYVEIWRAWKCRKHEKFCYNRDSYYVNCKDFVKRDAKEA